VIQLPLARSKARQLVAAACRRRRSLSVQVSSCSRYVHAHMRRMFLRAQARHLLAAGIFGDYSFVVVHDQALDISQ
jgi:hypothetical protein